MLIKIESWNFESFSSDMNEEDLDDNSSDLNYEEQGIVKDIGEDIVLVRFEFLRVELVENLHEHKGVEHHREEDPIFLGPGFFLVSSGGDSKHRASKEKQARQNSDLEEGLANDVSPHRRGHNCVLSWMRFFFEEIVVWRFRRKS